MHDHDEVQTMQDECERQFWSAFDQRDEDARVSYLESIETAARDYLVARDRGTPWPAVVAARERLRVVLGLPPAPELLVKPWDRR